jgi:hypothetical protein
MEINITRKGVEKFVPEKLHPSKSKNGEVTRIIFATSR